MFAEVKILVKVHKILAKRVVLQKGEMVKKVIMVKKPDLTFSDSLAKSIVMRKERFCMKSILFAILVLGC